MRLRGPAFKAHRMTDLYGYVARSLPPSLATYAAAERAPSHESGTDRASKGQIAQQNKMAACFRPWTPRRRAALLFQGRSAQSFRTKDCPDACTAARARVSFDRCRRPVSGVAAACCARAPCSRSEPGSNFVGPGRSIQDCNVRCTSAGRSTHSRTVSGGLETAPVSLQPSLSLP